jgi:hypothetical protein
MVPEPAINMICERNLLVPLHTGCASTSSIVVVMLKLPLIPRYRPVPEPATIGAAAATVTVPGL